MPNKSLVSSIRGSMNSLKRFKLAHESEGIIACVGYHLDELRDKTVSSDWMIKQIKQTKEIENEFWRKAAIKMVLKFSLNGSFELWYFNKFIGTLIFLNSQPVKFSIPETDNLIKLLRHVQSSAFDL